MAAVGATLHLVVESVDTLYVLLGEPAPDANAAGRTIETRTKETVDNDVEALSLELLIND